MQSKIVEDVEVTPDEVKVFFNSIPKDDLPIFGSELEVAQIVIKPKVSPAEEKRIIEQLETMRNDVLENGSLFHPKQFYIPKTLVHAPEEDVIRLTESARKW